MKFTIEIKHRWSTRIVFSAEIEAAENASEGVKTGLAVKNAVLRDAVLRDADLSEILEKEVPLIPNIDAAILASIAKNEAAGTNGLRMDSWHGSLKDGGEVNENNWCGTVHCRAGYAICLAGKEGFELERKYGPSTAGMLLYLKSTPDAPIPDWGASDKNAMADMHARAAKQTATP